MLKFILFTIHTFCVTLHTFRNVHSFPVLATINCKLLIKTDSDITISIQYTFFFNCYKL